MDPWVGAFIATIGAFIAGAWVGALPGAIGAFIIRTGVDAVTGAGAGACNGVYWYAPGANAAIWVEGGIPVGGIGGWFPLSKPGIVIGSGIAGELAAAKGFPLPLPRPRPPVGSGAGACNGVYWYAPGANAAIWVEGGIPVGGIGGWFPLSKPGIVIGSGIAGELAAAKGFPLPLPRPRPPVGSGAPPPPRPLPCPLPFPRRTGAQTWSAKSAASSSRSKDRYRSMC